MVAEVLMRTSQKVSLLNQQQARIIESLGYGMLSFDKAGTLTEVSDNARKILDLPRVKKLAGKSLDAVISQPELLAMLKNSAKSGKGKKVFHQTPDYLIECQMKPLCNQARKRTGTVVFLKATRQGQKVSPVMAGLPQVCENLLERMPDAVYILDAKGRILMMSEKALKLHNIKPPTRNRPTALKRLVAKDDWDKFEATLQKLKSKEPVNNVELTMVRKNGTKFRAELSFAPLQNSAGAEALFVVSARRVQQGRGISEAALIESEQRFRIIFETAQDSIFIKDCFLKYVQVNPAMERLFKAPASELIGKDDLELFGPEGGEHVQLMDRRVLQGEVVEEEYTKQVNKIPYTFHVIKVPVKNASGEIIGLCGIARDITGHRKFEADAKEKSDFLETVINSASEGIFVMNDKADYVLINPASGQIVAHKPDQWVGKRAGMHLHPDDIMKASLGFAKALSGGNISFEARVEASDGAYRYLNISLTGLSWAGKRHILGIVMDITERKRYEDKVIMTSSLLQATLEATADGILVVDNNGKIVSANNRFISLWNLPAWIVESGEDTLVSKFMLGQLKDPVGFVSRINQLHQTPKVHSFDTVEFKDGRVFERYSQPQILNGESVGRVWCFRNVTEAKRSEEELNRQQSETARLKSFLENVMDNMMSGLMVTDPNGVILILNRSGREMLHISENEALGKNADDVFPGFGRAMKENARRERSSQFLLGLKDGKTIPLGFDSSVLKGLAGETSGIITVFNDFTEVRELERSLKIKDKLTTTGKISSGIAHEIKNPLFAISASLQTLERNIRNAGQIEDHQAGETTEKVFAVLFREIQRINRLVEALSFYGSEQKLNVEKIALDELIEFILAANAGLIAEKGLQVYKRIPPVRPVIEADRDKLIQALTGILHNAIAFSPEKGTIGISVEMLNQGTKALINIDDQGPGIPKENLERIFDLFFSTRKNGAGMGLAIANKAIEMHDGTITAKNLAGGGSQFTLTIPARRESIVNGTGVNE
jgi:PAS domain S-box-containing protein